MDDALKSKGNKYLNVESWLLYVPPITIPGYAPDPNRNCLQTRLRALLIMVLGDKNVLP